MADKDHTIMTYEEMKARSIAIANGEIVPTRTKLFLTQEWYDKHVNDEGDE